MGKYKGTSDIRGDRFYGDFHHLRMVLALVTMLFLLAGLVWEARAFTIDGGSYRSLSSYSGIRKFNYAAKPVRENFISSDMVEPEYSFKTASKAVDVYFGTTANYTDNAGTKRKGFYLNKNSKGKCGVRYNKLFQYNNTWVDVKTTYTNWSLKDKKKAFATGGFCKIWWTNVKWLKMKHEFFVSGTDTPIQVKGFFTYIDVDDAQGLAIPADQIKKIWTNSKGTILKYKKEDGLLLIKSDDVLIPNESHGNYDPGKAATAMFSYQFAGKNHTQYVLDGNADSSDNVIGFDAAKYIPSMIPSPIPPAVEKSVSDGDETKVSVNTAASARDRWTYCLNGLVPLETEQGNFYKGFSLSDTLDSCLEIKSVKVYRNESQDVSAQFSISRSGQTVTASAGNCGDKAFYGCNYQLYIEAGIKPDAAENLLREHGHYDAGRDAFVFQNTGKVLYKTGSGEAVRSTNTVTTELPLPKLSVTKEASQKEYRVGDEIAYTVKVTQTRPKASALDLSIEDNSLPPEVKIRRETIQVDGAAGAQLTHLENGYKVRLDRLDYGQTVTIRYKARAEKKAADRDIVNRVLAEAMFVPRKTAQASVHINPYDIRGQKIWKDKDDQDGIRPASVTIRLLADGKPLLETTTDEKQNWKYGFKNLDRFDKEEREIRYTVEEVPIPGYTIQVSGFDLINTHPPEQVTIAGKKHWNDAENLDKLRPKRIIVYLMRDGERYASKTISAGDDWQYSWEVDKYRHRGRQIQYSIEEKPVDGYDTENKGFDLVNTHVPYGIRLSKYEKLESGEKTENHLSGAEYLAYRQGEKDREGSPAPDQYLGKYVTDKNGLLYVKGLYPGSYYFIEQKAPPGYEKAAERIDVEIERAEAAEKVKDAEITEVTAYNQRKYGSIEVVKKDDSGNSIAGAEFALYDDEACSQRIAACETDEKGTFRINNLNWGTYFLKEEKAPKGYVQSAQVRKITVGPESLSQVIKVQNQQKKGSIILTKTDESKTLRLKGAVYDLFDDGGRLIKGGLSTDEEGRIEVGNLSWGGYYFLEKQPPKGYGLSGEKIRFSVNSTTGGSTQHVEAVDSVEACQVTVNKQLRAEDIHPAHGTPCFVFRLSGETVDGEPWEEYQIVTFPEEYVKEHRDQNGVVQNSLIFSGLKAGTYTVEELDHIRYRPSGLSGMTENGRKEGMKAVFDLTEGRNGAVTFINEKVQWQDYSDTASKTNMIRLSRRLTGLVAEYSGKQLLEGNSPFPREKLKVTAAYDDGTEEALEPGEYALNREDGTPLVKVPKTAGTYTTVIEYEEDGISRRTAIGYKVEAVKTVTIRFDTRGGEPLAPLVAEKYDSLSDYKEGSYIPVRSGFAFLGWYEDQQCGIPFDTKRVLTEDRTLYAGWKDKHLDDYTWEEIKEAADSGMAETLFDECFTAVKEDLRDGTLSQETLRHMKAFSLNGQTYHAMLLGFNQDIKEDGTRAGISFLIQEPLATAKYNPQQTNRGGWKDSQLRQSLSDLSKTLPDVVAAVKKESWAYDEAGPAGAITWDRLWLLSQSEVCGAWGYEGRELEPSIYFEDTDWGKLRSGKGEGTQYKLFRNLVPDGAADGETALAFGRPWWLRSANLESDKGFCFIRENGAAR
ncbi:SpaA isopeptide-forming pilin-related protein [Anaerovorax odorimutans]|uniref:SpaA isopeptide-forming pilin-related protein n=1 Tax=Anaerovorax odorimutans TaxID=109327 RepID=A0ABT1RJJ9_9FIRM|nr:SpaA isopeptide-forming pilin-related protein [Anaerovorax odorimutans]MCQ4635340.1 SpaA isopeptide-forming pilin-related protein [Anaerovorax odorimutans]